MNSQLNKRVLVFYISILGFDKYKGKCCTNVVIVNLCNYPEE